MTEYIEKTQKELGAVISSPKLTEKLLSKPPFRFLHDVVTNFMAATGFPVGLFGDLEDFSKVDDKEKKLEFLTLLIKVIEVATGNKCSAKPAKIVSGSEPENTNEMLQMLASCASLSADKKEAAVKKVKSASERRASEKKEKEHRKSSAAEEKGKDKEEKKESKDKDKEKEEERERRHREKKEKEKEKEKEKKKEEKEKSKDKDKDDKETEEERRKRHEERKKEKEEKERRKKEEKSRKQSEDDRRTSGGAVAEPSTAGKAPPKTKPTHEVVVAHSAVDAAPVAGVIKEAKRGEGEDDSGDENDWQRVAEQYGETRNSASAAADDDVEVKGALGQQALKAKRRQEAAKRAQEEAASSTPAAATEGGIVIQTKRKGTTREGGLVMGDSELSSLREQLQLLTKASNPLGKFLEVIHDDIDSMLRELDMWRGEARTQQFAAEDAHRLTEEQLQETQAQLQDLEDAINDQLLKTNNLRRNILANDKAIQGMMRMVINPEVASRQ